MSNITHSQQLKLTALGKEPISLPAEIYFGGDEKLQKTPGPHHLPQYQKTGTYDHPLLAQQRKRAATDAAKRLIAGKMSETEHRKWGGLNGIQEKLAECGLKLTEDQKGVAAMHDETLQFATEMKAADRAKAASEYKEKTGKDYEPLISEPVISSEDRVAQAIAAAKAAVLGDADLSSLRSENEKEAGMNPSELNIDLASL